MALVSGLIETFLVRIWDFMMLSFVIIVLQILHLFGWMLSMTILYIKLYDRRFIFLRSSLNDRWGVSLFFIVCDKIE